MIQADLPENEIERLNALHMYNILDTLPEKEFDSLTRLASYICETPIALVSLIDRDRQWFKSSIGMDTRETSREVAFCSHAILKDDIFVVNDTLKDQRFFDNPLVTSHPDIRFYAGMPIQNPEGYKLGTLCVIDKTPRALTDEQKQALKDLSVQVMSVISLKFNEQLLNIAKDKIEEEKNNLFTLIENSDNSIWSVDKDLKILSLNSSFKDEFNRLMDFEPFIGMNLHEYLEFNNPMMQTWNYYYKRALNGEKVLVNNEFNINGNKTYNEASFSPIINNNQITGVTAFYKDITEQKINEIKLRESEERFRKFSEISIEGIAISESGKVIDVNNSLAKMLGYEREEMLLLPRTSFVTEEYRELVYNNSMDGYEEPYQVVALRKDGSTFPAEIVGRQIPYEGRVIRVISFRDITQSKKLEHESIKINGQLNAIISSLEDVVFEFDNNYVCLNVWINDPLALPLPNQPIIGKTIQETFGIEISNKYESLIKEVIKTNHSITVEHESMVNEKKHWFSCKITPINEKGKQTNRVSVMVENITLRKNMEEEIINAKIEAEKATQAKSDFLAMMSHEIRTPMNGVIGMTDLLLQTNLNSEQLDFVGTIKMSSNNLLEIINDILDFSKIESGKIELENKPLDLRTCIEDVFDLMSMKAAEKKLDLIYYISHDVPLNIQGDITRLKQILLNLVGNAIKFTERGEIFISVELESKKEDAYKLKITVKDTGIGISEKAISKLFQPFTQADISTTRKYGGTGLGLAIVKKLVELMKGNIRIESKENNGASFIFTIKTNTKTANSEIYTKENALKIINKKVLIVDSNLTKLKILGLQFSQWGMSATTIDSSAAALDLVKKNKYDLAIIDMSLPDMNGLLLGKTIKQISHDLPMILFSSKDMPKTKENYQVFSHTLTNPVKYSQLYNSLISIFDKMYTQVSVNRMTMPDTMLSNLLPLKILFAEDNLVNQKLTLKLLEKLGYSADLAVNGLEVIEKVSDKDYNIVLMDMQMPEMDGIDATKYIKKKYPDKNLKIIALTANAMFDDKVKCLEAGMDDFLTKPIVSENLKKALLKWGSISYAKI